ncbi:translation initiation factor IF-2 N-terminal domain-containing protein [Corynebacterium cystitidis]|uniref:translation initiation factor IF-2 N-terminal domain-containing protein n=1 Tax=Corynebacterium cystitidis TaxID=35757 RepID=UPI00211E591D|nr:translation initiation factor IF-2 N-terminal domain-containing protein [Corynebacterium cystitidis]
MADTSENTEQTDNSGTTNTAGNPDQPAKRRATKKANRKASRKATTNKEGQKRSGKSAKKTSKKVAKKTAKKTARKASNNATQTQRGTSATNTGASTTTSALQNFDRSQLGDKTRVFTLAKQLGLPSKDLVIALNGMGLVKVAQSSLTRAEAEQLVDVLQGTDADPNVDTTVPDDVAAEADEKIRDRVRKDVANEINQIENKVDADLASSKDTDEATGGATAGATDDELLTEIVPKVTPPPAEESAVDAHAPVFKAPSRSDRRRARRTSSSANAQQADENRAGDLGSDKGQGNGQDKDEGHDEAPEADVDVIDEPRAIKGSSRLEAQRRRRSEKRAEGRKRSRIVSEAEFLARRESVERAMIVRERERHDHHGRITQVGVLEDGLLVEHFVTSEENTSMIGNIYLGRVRNVLPSMEAAFIDIGQGRNGVLYAGEVDWKAAGLGGRSRRIENALKSGDQVVVQVSKDPVGQKGARLTTQISLAGRYLVYVPGGRSAGISRKLPAPERSRLKEILNNVVPGKGGAIIRTAAEGVSEEAIGADVNRLHNQWEAIQEQAAKEKASKGAKPVTLYEEPNMLVKVVRDLFNEDFKELVVDGEKSWNVVSNYVSKVAPDLEDRLVKFDRDEHDGADAFEEHRVDEQLEKALSRKVWLPSGGSLVIDRTEAMTVIDVNTGKFTGSGGSLEETVTSNNLEAAEEIVRQMRLRDIGGMIIVDFIDMILPENQELVLRRLKEALGRDRTRHQVSEVTSLGLVQMTRKRLGTGLLETFSHECETCGGRGIILSDDPVEHTFEHEPRHRRKPAPKAGEHPAARAMRARDDDKSFEGVDESSEAEAGDNDTGDAADQPRSSRRRRRSDRDLEDLADSVIGTKTDTDTDTGTGTGTGTGTDTDTDNGADEEADSEQREQREESGRRASRRRGRRGRGRGRGRQPEQSDNLVDHVDDTDDTDDPAVADDSAGTIGEGEKTYEEAVAEFEKSPRRKRRTRGNSRSDHRPRREDFQQPVEESTSQKPEVVVDKRSSEASSRSRRGRRRAVRRAWTSNSSPRKEHSTRNRDEDKAESAKAQESGADSPKTSSPRGRGRRRAVRRSMR